MSESAEKTVDEQELLAQRKALFWERTDYDRAFRGSFGAYMTRVEAEALDHVMGELEAPTLLDLGCGHGRFLRFFARRAERMVGLDRSRRLLDVAKQGFEDEPVGIPTELVFASATDIPLADGSCDAVTCVRVIQHVPDQVQCLRESRRVLSPEGRFVLVQYNWVSPHGLIRAFKIPVKALLRALIRMSGKEPSFDEPTKWISWPAMKRQLEENGFEVERVTGAWLFPLQYFRSKRSNEAWGPFLRLANLYERLARTAPFRFLGGYLIVCCRPRSG
jgi:ubiquinone/menaquinone biosynthesis C-methylase UbiE